jgi:hypothetical protein
LPQIDGTFLDSSLPIRDFSAQQLLLSGEAFDATLSRPGKVEQDARSRRCPLMNGRKHVVKECATAIDKTSKTL